MTLIHFMNDIVSPSLILSAHFSDSLLYWFKHIIQVFKTLPLNLSLKCNLETISKQIFTLLSRRTDLDLPLIDCSMSLLIHNTKGLCSHLRDIKSSIKIGLRIYKSKIRCLFIYIFINTHRFNSICSYTNIRW
jgi:hypothetical protein